MLIMKLVSDGKLQTKGGISLKSEIFICFLKEHFRIMIWGVLEHLIDEGVIETDKKIRRIPTMTSKLFFLRMLICMSISGGSIFTFTTSFADAADASDPSLILYFSFDELEGDMFTKVPDLSQYGNDGTLVGEPELVEGKYGMALQLDGQMDWVEVPHADSLTVDEAVTVMAWINTERHGSNGGARWQGILAKGNNPRSYSFYTESRNQCLCSVYIV